MNNVVIFSVEIGGKSSGSRKAGSYGNGMKTLRLRSKGSATVEVVMWTLIIIIKIIIMIIHFPAYHSWNPWDIHFKCSLISLYFGQTFDWSYWQCAWDIIPLLKTIDPHLILIIQEFFLLMKNQTFTHSNFWFLLLVFSLCDHYCWGMIKNNNNKYGDDRHDKIDIHK